MSEDTPSSGAYYSPAPFPAISLTGETTNRTAAVAQSAATQAARDFLNGGSGGPSPFALEQVPGVGTVLFNKTTGDVQLLAPAPPSPGRAPAASSYLPNPYTGTLYSINPNTGAVTDLGVPWGTPENMLRAYDDRVRAEAAALQRELLEANQAFQAQESDYARRQSLILNVENQNFQQEQSYLDRVARASEIAYQGARDQAQIQLAWQAQVQAAKDSWMARKAQARSDFASFVVSPNTAALNAWLAASGGGTLANAEANPNAPSLLTDRALMPAASAWQAVNEPQPTPPPMPVIPAYNPVIERPTPRPSPTLLPAAPYPGANMTGGGGGGGTNYAAAYGAGTWNPGNANTGYVGSVDAGGNLVATPTAEHGGTFDAPAVIVGDSKSGRENPELVQAFGPYLQVTPLERLEAPVRREVTRRVPKAAEGGLYQLSEALPNITGATPGTSPGTGYATNVGSLGTQPSRAPAWYSQAGLGPSDGSLSPETAQLIDQIRRWRQGFANTPLPALGVNSRFDPRFGLLSPTSREQWALGEQTRSGVPASEYLWEAQRYSLAGVPRGGGYMGI